jgi:ABC transporter substrate binding protein
VIAQPIKVGVESGDQLREAAAEARTRCCLGVIVKKDVVALPQPRGRARALQRSAHNGKNPLVESCESEFITLIGGASAAWPLAAGAQQRTNAQTQKVYRIGFLFAGTIALRPQAQEFWRKLQELGYIEGKNLVSEIREARGDVDRLPKLASEIVDTHPDVIVAVTSPATAAAKMATQTIPIVMAIVPDPVGLGLVESLARPGTNITGSSSLQIETIPKRVQLIKEILPELSILGMLWNAKVASNRLMFSRLIKQRGLLGFRYVPSRCKDRKICNQPSTKSLRDTSVRFS